MECTQEGKSENYGEIRNEIEMPSSEVSQCHFVNEFGPGVLINFDRKVEILLGNCKTQQKTRICQILFETNT
jgi:hypothetical protein